MTDAANAPIWGRADIVRMVSGWDEQRRYDTYARRVARYLPIWHAGFARYADAADLAPAKRALFTQRMTELLERCDAIRAAEPMPKARLNETESAISALSNGALRTFGTQPWTTTVRRAALTARHLLRIAKEGASSELFAAGVYHWAEIESRFPGDSASLLQQLTPDERRSAGPGYSDGHHLLYGRPCREWGMEAEGLAVYASVAEIMRNLDADPGRYEVDEDFWEPRGDVSARQRAAAYEDFHGRKAPTWLP